MEVLKQLPKSEFAYGAAFTIGCQLTSPTLYQCEEYDPPSDDYYDSEPTDESQPSLETDGASEVDQTVTVKQDETLSSIDDEQEEEEEE